jgi:hypothetical protein
MEDPKMSDGPYEKECMYCKNKILMSKESGKWLPYNLNNGPHDCRKKNYNGSESKQQEQQNKQEITLEMVRKKLESIRIIINVERLMKE